MDILGQITIEFLLIIGLILIMILVTVSYVGDEIELIETMSTARSGAIEGASINSFAIYPEDSFYNSIEKHPRILSPNQVKIIKIDYKNFGFDSYYNKIKIQIHITASASTVNLDDKNPLGDRINFYTRKRICESFSTSNLTNREFNPAYSKKYVFTTSEVKWIK